MGWVKVILDLLSKGLEWLNNNQLLQAGRDQEKLKQQEGVIDALKARDNVNADNADKFMLPPDER